MMRYVWLGLVLALTACGEVEEPTSPEHVVEATAEPASEPGGIVAADTSKGAAALLGRLVEPRRKGALAPRDECASLPGARAFREKLAAAVLARDAEAIAAMAVPDVKLGFGGEDGRAKFLADLKAPGGEAMRELEKVLRLGCAGSEGGGLVMPWYFQQAFGDIDSYSGMLVTGVDVPLRAKPSTDAAVTDRLSWSLVSLWDGLRPDALFQRVTDTSGQEGYVATDRLRSLLDYRLLAIRQDGEWKITAFLAGD